MTTAGLTHDAINIIKNGKSWCIVTTYFIRCIDVYGVMNYFNECHQ